MGVPIWLQAGGQSSLQTVRERISNPSVAAGTVLLPAKRDLTVCTSLDLDGRPSVRSELGMVWLQQVFSGEGELHVGSRAPADPNVRRYVTRYLLRRQGAHAAKSLIEFYLFW